MTQIKMIWNVEHTEINTSSCKYKNYDEITNLLDSVKDNSRCVHVEVCLTLGLASGHIGGGQV